jgi:outer membrane protein OmpA-like peptidoglycan-associated protein
MRHILLLLALCTNISVSAQNLILNPGFEVIDTSYALPIEGTAGSETDTFDLHNVVGFYNPSFATTDYYNCDGKHAHCGSRYFSRGMKAHSGYGYAGIYIERSKWKEYIGVVLKDTLRAGKNYRLSFWMAISPKSRIAMNTMQVEFWDTSYVKVAYQYSEYPRSNPRYPTIDIPRTNQVAMVGNWAQVSMAFTAIGGEKSFVLSYFDDYWQTTSTPETPKNKNNDPYCYYYLDDFELVEISGSPIPRKTTVRPIIYFDTDKDAIKKQFYAPLDSVVTNLKQNAAMKIIVNGFTDSVGNVEDNLDLSRRRAEAVKKYLVDHGIAESRITTAWYAESRPAGDENAINRRVEFVYIRP